MFTGLIETTGSITATDTTAAAARLSVSAPGLAGRLRTGDSVAVNGTCLTALEAAPGDFAAGRFVADLAAETVQRTTLATLAPASVVNLELPTPAGAPLGGHVVQGHVDGRGRLVSLVELHPGQPGSDWRLTVWLPAALRAHVVPQGSITIDGISLTVAAVQDVEDGATVEIAVIPHTYAATHLHTLQAGAALNIETDVLARYAQRRESSGAAGWQALSREVAPQQPLTVADLLSNGY